MADARVVISRKAARAQGLTRYFTGKSCKSGHVDERQVANGVCLSCAKRSMQTYRRVNADVVRERNKKYKDANPEWSKEQSRKFYAANKEEFSAKAKIWRSNNQEKTKADKIRWREENRDAYRAQRRNRKARKRQNGGTHNAADVLDILRLQNFKCACCTTSLKNKPYHVDHITPLVKGGGNGRRNLQVLCVSCNLSKSKLDPLVFMRSKGKLL